MDVRSKTQKIYYVIQTIRNCAKSSWHTDGEVQSEFDDHSIIADKKRT